MKKLEFVTITAPTKIDNYQRHACEKQGYTVVGYDYKSEGRICRPHVHFAAYYLSMHLERSKDKQEYKTAKQAMKACQRHHDVRMRQQS